MVKKISHSGWKKYMTCGKLYEYHYKDKLRPLGTGSPLYFGSAMDEALNQLLLHGKDPIKVFQEEFKLEKMTDVVWRKEDWDPKLFSPSQLDELKDRDINYQNWASMRVKGRMMLEAWVKDFFPLIEEVHEVQGSLNNRRGFLDIIVTLKGHGKVLIDNKTSKRRYQDDAIDTDTQLPLYAEDVGVHKVGFAVMVKTIKHTEACVKCKKIKRSSHKTCNALSGKVRCHGEFEVIESKADFQLLVQKLDEGRLAMVKDAITKTEEAIDAKIFPPNLSACHKMYGANCPYLLKCSKGLDTGLRKEE